MKKILIGLGVLLLIAGGYWFFVMRDNAKVVENEELIKSYDKMEVGEDGINGYILELRIFGMNEEERVFEAVRIRNYMDTSFEITLIDDSDPEESEEIDIDRDEIMYIIDDVTYVKNEEGRYVETTEEIPYNDPSIYLEGIKHITSDTERVVEEMGQHTYYTYDVSVAKSAVEKMLADTNLKNYKIESDIEATVYLDDQDYVYRIVYKFDRLTIHASYFAVNNSFEIRAPIDDYYDPEMFDN